MFRLDSRHSLIAFQATADDPLSIEVVDGDPIEWTTAQFSGPFPDEPDGQVRVGQSRELTRDGMLRTTGTSELELRRRVVAEEFDNRPPGPPEGEN